MKLYKKVLDSYSVLQLFNTICGGLVSLIAMFLFSDSDILTSQTLISLTLLSVTFLAIDMATASIDVNPSSSFSVYRRRILTAFCCVTWLVLVTREQEILPIFLYSAAFGVSILVGEYSAVWRAAVINSSGPRIRLIYINTIASIVRLVFFLALFAIIDPLEAFIASAAVSNFGRAITLYIYAKSLPDESWKVTSRRGVEPKAIHKVGAYLDRNPTIVVVLAITSGVPLFGLAALEYSLSVLIMSFCANISSYMWTRYENTGRANIAEKLVQPVLLMIFSALLFLAFFMLLPADLIEAQSLLSLQAQPISLIIVPACFGFSFGLNVFSYGSSYSWLRALVLAWAFYYFGSYGFSIGLVINVVFFGLAVEHMKTVIDPR